MGINQATKKGNNHARMGLWDECLINTKKENNQARIDLWDECLMVTKRGITKLEQAYGMNA